MRFWALATGGLLVWAAHFLGLYLLASVADVARDDAGAWRGVGLTFSLACLAVAAGLGLNALIRSRARSDDATQGIGLALQAGAAAIGAVGVIFQTMVLLAPA